MSWEIARVVRRVGPQSMTAKSHKQERELDEQLGGVISHEITIKVLVVLVERAASPKEIADLLGFKVPTVSHHVKKLEGLGLVELVEEKEVRGAIQHIYRAVIRPIVSTEDWEKLGIDERQRFSIWVIQLILADAARSLSAKAFDAHAARHLSRIPVVVDKEGLEEVSRIQDKAMHDIIQVEAASAERMVQKGETGMNLIAAMMCFELPQPSDPFVSHDGAGGKRFQRSAGGEAKNSLSRDRLLRAYPDPPSSTD